MSDDVTQPWWPSDIRLVTDRDLESKRYARGGLSDPSAYAAQLVETARRSEGLETTSATIDRALRVELAYLIDSRSVTFDRDTYDIAYLIPPRGWVSQQQWDEQELVITSDLPEDLDPEERSMPFTTAEVVYEMLQDAVAETDHETLSELIRNGLERLVGRQ